VHLDVHLVLVFLELATNHQQLITSILGILGILGINLKLINQQLITSILGILVKCTRPVAAMSASSTPLSKAIKARRATVLESYFISSRNSANSGPLCLLDASPRKRAKIDSSASSSGSKPDEDCSTPARTNIAVKLICPGGLPSNPNPHSTSICVESESDLVEVINVADFEVPVAKKKQKNVKVRNLLVVSVRIIGLLPIHGPKCSGWERIFCG
jgi:hypothetical protein